MTDLSALRGRIDELDHELIRVVAERLTVCEEVARFKEGSDTPVIQPARVREVRRTIARIRTLQGERSRAAAKA